MTKAKKGTVQTRTKRRPLSSWPKRTNLGRTRSGQTMRVKYLLKKLGL